MDVPRGISGLALTLALTALTPGLAAAADRYVDPQTGSDDDVTCPQGDPCATVQYAVVNSGAGDEIILDNGIHLASVTLGDGRSISFGDFVPGDSGPALLEGGTGTPMTVAASGAGHIRGLTIRGQVAGVTLNGVAEVDGNTFDEPESDAAAGVIVATGGAGSLIHDNAFSDPTPGMTRQRVGVSLDGAAEVRDNTLSGFMIGIAARAPQGGDTLIAGNTVTGTHTFPFGGSAISAQRLPGGGAVTVRGNSISAGTGNGEVGISAADEGVRLVRNNITGQSFGVVISADSTGVTLEGDRIWGNGRGLWLRDNNPVPVQTSAAATNVTVVGNNADGDFFNERSALALDSSIVGTWGVAEPATCTIAFSRGATTGDPSSCDDFQTTADPTFANAASGDFHLLPGSPMIDSGNPVAPAMGAVDFEGDPRAVDGMPECSGNVDRRDIGADEFVPAPPDCDPPDTTFTKTPPKRTKRKTVRFKFEATEPGSFVCQLDERPEFSCGSPQEVNVGVGRHKFLVTSTDNANNQELQPAKYRFRRVR